MWDAQLTRRLGRAIKQISLVTGAYRPARWLARQTQPRQLRQLRADVALYRDLLPPESLCFDVGANIGEKSEALLKARCRVVAFEPNPLVLPELRARCGRSKDWQLVAAAVGAGSAVATLQARAEHGQSGFVKDWIGNVVGTFEVPVVTLDAAIEHYGVPAYCKIDVEGWEFEVLRGLSQAVDLISLEFHLTDRDIAKTRACLELLEHFGPTKVNLTPAERAAFHLPEWMPLPAFRAWFPGDLRTTLPGNPYGDIYVSRDPPE